MIGPDEAQEGIISKLKADVALVAWLTTKGVADEIREDYWQAKDFKYPNVRVVVGLLTPYGLSECSLKWSEVLFSVQAFSVENSSQQCGHLIGLVVDALFGKGVQTSTWRTQKIELQNLTGPVRASEDVWQSQANFRMLTQE